MHYHQHCVLFDLARIEERIILVVFVGGEHSLGEEALKFAVEILPFFRLVFLGRLHSALEGKVAHLERLSAHDTAQSRVLEVGVNGEQFFFVHAERSAHIFERIVFLRRGAQVKTVYIHLDLLFVAIGQMFVDEKIVNERETFH